MVYVSTTKPIPVGLPLRWATTTSHPAGQSGEAIRAGPGSAYWYVMGAERGKKEDDLERHLIGRARPNRNSFLDFGFKEAGIHNILRTLGFQDGTRVALAAALCWRRIDFPRRRFQRHDTPRQGIIIWIPFPRGRRLS